VGRVAGKEDAPRLALDEVAGVAAPIGEETSPTPVIHLERGHANAADVVLAAPRHLDDLGVAEPLDEVAEAVGDERDGAAARDPSVRRQIEMIEVTVRDEHEIEL